MTQVKVKVTSKIDAKIAALPKVSRGDTPLAKRTRPKVLAKIMMSDTDEEVDKE